MRNYSVLAVAMVVIMLITVACGGAKTPAPEPTQAPAAAAPTEAPAAAAPTEGPKPTEAPKAAEPYVGFVPPALTSPFHVAMVDGATARSKELGYKLDVQAPASEGDFQAFVTTVQQLLEKGVQVISINPIGTDSAVTAVKAANEKGVPILAHNFITPFSEGKVESYIGYDQWGGAEKLAKTTCELIAKKYNSTPAETKGKVFILLGIDSIFSHRRTGGFKAGLTKYCPNVVVVGEQTAEWLRTKGSEVATIAWQKDPDIDVFYGNSDEMAIGAALAGEQLGKTINKDFFAVGIDGNQPTLDLLGQGKFSATLGVDPVRMGVTVVDTMQKILAGERVPEIILTPSVVVTPENLAAYEAGKLWTEPVAGAPETDNNLPTVPEAETKPAAGAAAATGTLTLWHGWTGAEADTLAELVKAFETANPGAKVELLAVPFDQLKNKFTTEASTGGGPDLLIGPKDWIGELAQAGLISPLDDLASQIGLDQLNQSAVDANKFQGQTWAFPESTEAVALWYNKDKVKTPPKDTDELIKLASEVGLAYNSGFYHSAGLLLGEGGRIFDENGKCALTEGASVVDGLTIIANAKGTPSVIADSDGSKLDAAFKDGKVGLIFNGPWGTGDYVKALGAEKLGIADPIAVGSGKFAPFLGTKNVFLSANSQGDAKNAALAFLKFMSQPDTQGILAKIGHIPSNPNVKVDDPLQAGFLKQTASASYFPNEPEMGAVWTPGADMITKVIEGKASPADAVAEACKTIDTANNK